MNAPFHGPRFLGGPATSRRITSSKCSRSTGPWCFSRSRRSSSVYFLRLAACEARRLFVAADRRPLGCMGGSSASCQDGPENLGIVAVVEAPREFVEVERQVRLADLVERADDAALQERPEGIEVLRVDVAVYVLIARVRHGRVRPVDVPIANVLVRRDEAHLVRDGLVDE